MTSMEVSSLIVHQVVDWSTIQAELCLYIQGVDFQFKREVEVRQSRVYQKRESLGNQILRV